MRDDHDQLSMLASALAYAQQGIEVFPCHTPMDTVGGCSCGSAECPNAGKHPRTRNGVKDATTDAKQITVWWTRWPDANIGAATGIPFIVLDVDHGPAGLQEIAQFPAPVGPRIRTGNGQHLIFANTDPKIGNRAQGARGWPFKHCDLRGMGGYIIMPPSLHRSGTRYTYITSPDLPVPEIPDWLADALATTRRERSKPVFEDYFGDDGTAADTLDPEHARQDAEKYVQEYIKRATDTGNRNDRGIDLACQLRDLRLDITDARQYMRQYQEAVDTLDDHAYPWDEAEKTLISAYSRNPRDPAHHGSLGGYRLTDIGNAERFVAKFRRRFRYVPEARKWIRWQVTNWEWDTSNQAQEAAKTISVDIFAAASRIPDGTQYDPFRRQCQSWAKSSGLASHVASILTLASSDPRIITSIGELDADPVLYNFPNGTFDLRTMELLPHRREDMITKCAAAPYDPNAKSALWTLTKRRFVPSEAMQTDLMTAGGYGFSGRAKEHLFLCVGETKCGKSTIINAMKNAMGTYATDTDFETFASAPKNAGGSREDLVALVGSRMVVMSESNRGDKLNGAQLKRVTGSDTLSMRANYGKQFTALPTFSLWMLTNHEPRVAADDGAIWERVHVFKFDQYIPPDERDETERDKLLSSQEVQMAILADMMRGWQRFRTEQNGRLKLPTTVRETAAYRTAQDMLGQFINECCTTEQWERTAFGEFKRAFIAYIQREGVKESYSSQRIGRDLLSRGYKREESNGVVSYLGLSVRREWLSKEDISREFMR